MTTNISVIHENVFLLYDTMYNINIYFSLCKKIYDDNKHISYYTSSRKTTVLLYDTMYNDNIYLSLYKRVYNDKHFCYT